MVPSSPSITSVYFEWQYFKLINYIEKPLINDS